ncbi:MAG TPA: hypothetical protein VN618_14380 [Solirubrobacteraceae bacterium]|nr:hypothetical protein [Solirubrobacteraceae bacterium]
MTADVPSRYGETEAFITVAGHVGDLEDGDMTSGAGTHEDRVRRRSAQPRHHESKVAPPDARTALLRAAERMLVEQQPRDITVAALCARACTTRAVFGGLFAGRADCLFALYDELEKEQAQLIATAYRAHEDWQDGLRAVLVHALQTLERNPALARILVLPARGEEPALTARRARTHKRLAAALASVLPPAPVASSAPIDACAIVGTAAAVVRGRLRTTPTPDLAPLCGPLMAMIVMPYLGVEASSRELAAGSGSSGPSGSSRTPVRR